MIAIQYALMAAGTVALTAAAIFFVGVRSLQPPQTLRDQHLDRWGDKP